MWVEGIKRKKKIRKLGRKNQNEKWEELLGREKNKRQRERKEEKKKQKEKKDKRKGEKKRKGNKLTIEVN